MLYLLQRLEDKKFVAHPHLCEHSYTQNVRLAFTWTTKEAAANSACDNERVMHLLARENRLVVEPA